MKPFLLHMISVSIDKNPCISCNWSASYVFFSVRNKKNEKKNATKKGKDIEKSILTATFVPSQDSKIDNRIISQVADNKVANHEDPVQITYRPTIKNK